MRFFNVIEELKKSPNHSFVSCVYDENTRYLKLYIAKFDSNEEWLTVFYEGGKLFCEFGEEDCYSMDDLPASVKALNFQRYGDYSSLMGRLQSMQLTRFSRLYRIQKRFLVIQTKSLLLNH